MNNNIKIYSINYISFSAAYQNYSSSFFKEKSVIRKKKSLLIRFSLCQNLFSFIALINENGLLNFSSSAS